MMAEACEMLKKSAGILYGEHDATPLLKVDTVLESHKINLKTIADIEVLRPFGMGFSAPLFLLENISASVVPLGQTGEHIRWDIP